MNPEANNGYTAPGSNYTGFEGAQKIESAMDRQVGGAHYKGMAIQSIEYIQKNGMDYLSGNVIKYVSRHSMKNGAEDIKKAIHYCELILELVYNEKRD